MRELGIPDRGGPADPAGAAASAATAHRPHLQRAQLRLPAGAQRARRGVGRRSSTCRPGYRVVVDVDLEKFFDRVNHDILMDRLAKRIADKAGAAADPPLPARRHHGARGGCRARRGHAARRAAVAAAGQRAARRGGRELERRGHSFVRYADDCNVYVRSQRRASGCWTRCGGCYAQAAAEGQRDQDGGGEVWGRKFLGYCFWVAPGGEVKRAVAEQAVQRCKQRIRQLTRRTDGRSIEQIAAGPAGLRAGLEGVLPAGADAQGLREPRRMAASPPARHPAQALAARARRCSANCGASGASVDAGGADRRQRRRWWRNSGMG